MLVGMAQKMSLFFVSKNIIKEEERQIYDYCFEILLSTIINFIALLILAILSGTLVQTICFMIGFITVRITAGGFHAETHLGCLLTLLVAYSSYLAMLMKFRDTTLRTFTIAFLAGTFLLVFAFSPVEDHNRPFGEEEYKRFKLKSYFAVIMLTIILGVCVVIIKNIEWGFSISAGMCVVSISLVVGYIKNKFMKFKMSEGDI